MQIGLILFDGFDNLDAIAPFEVFNHAQTTGANLTVGLYTLDAQHVVSSNHGLSIVPDGELESVDHDIVIVPGGGWSSGANEGIRAQIERGDLTDTLARLHDEGVILASVCTGGMALAAANILRGRPAVTHHSALDDLAAAGAEVIDTRVVDDGEVLTAGGITAGIDLALHLLDREFSEPMGDRVARAMEYERQDDVHLV